MMDTALEQSFRLEVPTDQEVICPFCEGDCLSIRHEQEYNEYSCQICGGFWSILE